MTVNNLKTSDAGRDFIEQFEGLDLKAYNDGTGVVTIGYGHTTAAGPPAVNYGMVITKDQADQFLAADLAGAREGRREQSRWPSRTTRTRMMRRSASISTPELWPAAMCCA